MVPVNLTDDRVENKVLIDVGELDSLSAGTLWLNIEFARVSVKLGTTKDRDKPVTDVCAPSDSVNRPFNVQLQSPSSLIHS